MTGDIADFVGRLRALLPTRWFPDQTPVLDTLLNGLAWCWTTLFDCLTYVRQQSRISTASDAWLDAIADDYFGSAECRRGGQPDDRYRPRILRSLLREHGTRQALHSVLEDLTGRTPAIFEPANPADAGGYGLLPPVDTGLAYGLAGGWGSLVLPFQSFVTAFRPAGAGIGTVIGWGGTRGAYGAGDIEYASPDMITGQVTDGDICRSVAVSLPAASICWMRISS